MAIPPGYDATIQSVEYYTPERYIRSVRNVLGDIDLDPASNPIANTVVGAKKFYTKEQDGMLLPWYGKVFCNPPYGRYGAKSAQQVWSMRLVAEYEAGHVQEAILLTSSTDQSTVWYQKLMGYPHCITNHRISFWTPKPRLSSRHNRAMGGSLFSYFGHDMEKFFMEFYALGACILPEWQPPVRLEHTLLDFCT